MAEDSTELSKAEDPLVMDDAGKAKKGLSLQEQVENIQKEINVLKSKVDGTAPESDNQFTQRKHFLYKFFDVSLVMANISQLKTVWEAGDRNQYYTFLMAMILSSMVLQVVCTLIMVCVYFNTKREEKRGKDGRHSHKKLRFFCKVLDRICIVIVFFILLFNVCITGIGLVDKHAYLCD